MDVVNAPWARSGAAFHQAFSQGDGDGLRAGGRAQLLEEEEDMRLDAPLADAELLGDVVVGQTVRDGGKDLVLARRQLGNGRVVAVLRLADDVDVRFRAEERGDAHPDDEMVIDDGAYGT